jgi:succinate dehydrogenase/fumarate reductase cytochrome b subunit
MHTSLKIIKTLLYSYSALHVSGTLAPIIWSLLILHIQPPVTMCRWVGCVFQLWSVTTVAFVCLWVGIPTETM